MFKKTITAFAVMLGLLFGAFAIQAPASASYSDCTPGVGCVWTGEFGTGTLGQIPFSGFGPVGSCHNWTSGSPWFNNVHSASATYGNFHGLRLYVNQGCGGPSYTVAANSTADFAPGSSWSSYGFESFSIT